MSGNSTVRRDLAVLAKKCKICLDWDYQGSMACEDWFIACRRAARKMMSFYCSEVCLLPKLPALAKKFDPG